MDYQSLKTLRAPRVFGNIGLPPELVLPIGLLEVIGGIALTIGVLTRIAAALLIIDMIGVIILVKISEGFVIKLTSSC
jgi:putative oxidoreductase